MSTQTLDQAFGIFKRITKSDKEAMELVKLFRSEVEEEVKKVVSTKAESLASKQDISELEIRLIDRIAESNEKLAKVESNLSWKLLLFWVAQLGAMFGFLHYFLK